MPRLSVPLTDDQHAAIRRKAGALGVPQAEVARRLLLAWVRGEMEMPTIGDIYRLLAGSSDSPCEFGGLAEIIE